MSGLEDRLSLDIQDALSAIDQIEAAFVQAGKALQEALDQAIAAFQIPDSTVELTAQVTPDTSEVTPAIDAAVAEADQTIDVHADVSGAQDAISSLQGETVDVEVQAVGTEEAAASIDALAGSSEHAATSTHSAAEEVIGLSAVSKLAAGETGALKEVLEGAGGAGVAAAAGIGAFTVVGAELVSNAIDARSAQERYNLVLGEFAETVDRIDVGGLNTDLESLSTLLGATGIEVENAASKIFSLGTTSGKAGPEVAQTTKEVIALAARAVALNPALGNVGDVAERLFTGLARGGRFAANFNLSLTAAEITARALGDTGKATAADLTIYEKAAAGAALATEKLGPQLGKDVEAGAQNIRTQFNSVKASFEEALEAFGQPLLDPLLESIRKAEPILAELAGSFADVLAGVLPIIAAIADGLGPALDVVAPLAQGLGEALKIIADVLDIIPGPLKAVVVSFIALNVAMKAIAATRVASVLAGFGGPLSNIGTLALPATVALTATGAAIAFLNSQAKKTDEAVQNFLDPFVGAAQTAASIEDLAKVIDQVHVNAQKERDAAAGDKGGFLGGFAEHGEIRGEEEAAAGFESLGAAGDELIRTAKSLQKEFGLTSVAALALARSGEANIEAFREQAGAAKEVTAETSAAARATDDFWLAAQAGSLSAVDIQERATATGATFDDLSKAVQDARQPIIDFAQGITDALPGAAAALDALGKNEGLNTFVKNLEENVKNASQFVGNLQTLIDRGATDLAKLLGQLASTDPEKAASLAAEAVAKGPEKLLELEGKIDATNFGQNLVNSATQHVADELGGGLELATNQARERFGSALEKIPGQLGEAEVGSKVASAIAFNVLNADALASLPSDLEALGKNSAIGFAAGIQGNESEVVFAAVSMAKAVTKSVSGFLGIQSPSKVFQDLGELTAQGFLIGLADLKGAADIVDPILGVVDKFKLGASDIAKATGDSVDQIVASLTDLGEAEKKITPDELLKVGDAVKALGGAKGVKDLQNALAQRTAAAFGGLDSKSIADVVSKLNTQAALTRVQSLIGVTPKVPTPFETNVVKGPDSTAPNVELTVNVTPPPEATPEEIAALTANAVGWQLQGVQ